MTPEDIERIVKVIMGTTDRDIQRILKDYLAWKLMPPSLVSATGSIKYVEKP